MSISRRMFLRTASAAAATVALSACGATQTPTPVVIEKTVVQTQIVEKTVVSVQTQIVEKTVEKVVTATAVPATAVPQLPKEKQIGGTLNIWLDSRWPETSWLHISSWQSAYAIGPMADCLFRMKADDTLDPQLAEKFDVSADGLTYKISLRKGVTWHDGTPFTADDVVFTFQTYYRPDHIPLGTLRYGTTIKDLKAYQAGTAKELTGIKALDANTVQVTLDTPDASLPNLFLTMYLPICQKAALQKLDPTQLLNGKADYWYTKPVGTGPYKFVRYVTDQYLEYARNDNYWGGKVGPEKLFMKIASPDVAEVMLQKGELDIFPRLPFGEVDRVKAMPNIVVQEAKQTGSFWGVEFNYETKNGFWRDPKAKQAFMYATDRPGYVKSILKGYGTLPNSFFDGTPYACPTMITYDFNPDTAKKLFDSIGMTADKRAQTTLTLMAWLGLKDRQDFLPVAQENLRQLGFKVNVDIIDASLVNDYISGKTGRDWDIHVLAAGPGFDPGSIAPFTKSDSASNFGARGIPSWWINAKPVAGSWVYKNDKVDTLLVQGQTEVDPARRKAIYQQVDCIWNADLPAATFAFASDIIAMNNRVQGLDWPNWAGLGMTNSAAPYHVGDWWIWQK